MLEITGTDLTAEQFSMIKIVLSALFMAIALIVCKILNLGMLYLVAAMAVVGAFNSCTLSSVGRATDS